MNFEGTQTRSPQHLTWWWLPDEAQLVRLEQSAGRVALPLALTHMCVQVHMYAGILANAERWALAHWGACFCLTLLSV